VVSLVLSRRVAHAQQRRDLVVEGPEVLDVVLGISRQAPRPFVAGAGLVALAEPAVDQRPPEPEAGIAVAEESSRRLEGLLGGRVPGRAVFSQAARDPARAGGRLPLRGLPRQREGSRPFATAAAGPGDQAIRSSASASPDACATASVR
jgi:hypothetical protein